MREGQETIQRATGAGITPAYAGRTLYFNRLLIKFRDHPRLCGKDSALPDPESEDLGSPPLMREGRCILLILLMFYGITPAYAGRTKPVTM